MLCYIYASMNYLKAPYPFFHQGKELIKNALLIVLFGFTFDYFFEPFNVARSEHTIPYWGICLVHSSSAASIYLLTSLIAKPLINEDQWKLWREFCFLALCLLLIGIGSFLWREVIYDNPNNVSLRYLIEEVRNTFLVGSLILFFITTINFRLLEGKNRKSAQQLSSRKATEEHAIEPRFLEIKTKVSADDFQLLPEQLICAKADGNYVEFYSQNGSHARKQVARISLSEAHEQLRNIPKLVKTHRAYLVNTQHVQKVEGNAQGYQLTCKNLDFKIPVSRTNLAQFKQAIG